MVLIHRTRRTAYQLWVRPVASPRRIVRDFAPLANLNFTIDYREGYVACFVRDPPHNGGQVFPLVASIATGVSDDSFMRLILRVDGGRPTHGKRGAMHLVKLAVVLAAASLIVSLTGVAYGVTYLRSHTLTSDAAPRRGTSDAEAPLDNGTLAAVAANPD